MSMENKEEMISSLRLAVRNDDGLRERVRALVLKTLVEREVDPAAIKAVMRGAVAGVGDGLVQRGGQAGGALREAVHGLDEAVSRAVYALQMAMEESWGEGRQFAQTDLRATADALKDLEADLLATLDDAAGKTQGWLKGEFTGLRGHLARTGTDTGRQVGRVLELLNNRLAAAAAGAGSEVRATAVEAGGRLVAVASGVLRGLADSIDARFK